MQLTVQGQKIDVGEALSTHVEEKLEDLNRKYFNHATFATVTFSKEGHGHGQIRAHINIQVGKDILVIGEDTAPDAYAAFDSASEKVGKQMRRYKKRLRDHRDRVEQTPEGEIMKARDYVLAAQPELSDEDHEKDQSTSDEAPVIVAEMTTDIQTLSVSDAVMRMDLAGEHAMLFRNSQNQELNMVYRRSDGNIGWIDPSINLGNSKSAANG